MSMADKKDPHLEAFTGINKAMSYFTSKSASAGDLYAELTATCIEYKRLYLISLDKRYAGLSIDMMAKIILTLNTAAPYIESIKRSVGSGYDNDSKKIRKLRVAVAKAHTEKMAAISNIAEADYAVQTANAPKPSLLRRIMTKIDSLIPENKYGLS